MSITDIRIGGPSQTPAKQPEPESKCKAAVWAKRLKFLRDELNRVRAQLDSEEAPSLLIDLQCTSKITVGDDGQCCVRVGEKVVRLRPREALLMAKWIIENFSEPEEEENK
jgi:hypothetical protein